MNNAQSTMEYLVIMAIIIIIALVVVTMLINLTGSADGVTTTDSQIYWQKQILAITDMAIDSDGDGKLVIKNNTSEKITLTSVLVNGISIPITDENLFKSETSVLHGENIGTCTGQTTSYEIEIHYTTSHGLNKTLYGDKPYIVSCAGDIEGLTTATSISLDSPSNGAGDELTDVDFEFTITPGSYTIVDCNLWLGELGSMTQQAEVTSESLTGEQTFEITDLTGGGTTYYWNIVCVNSSGTDTWAETPADSNYSFTIPNQTPTITFISPDSGTYSGGMTLTFDVSDPDSGTDLNALIYYSTTRAGFPDENLIADINLISDCFGSTPTSTVTRCTYNWEISDNSLAGDYYIDINVFDGERDANDSSNSTITITNCVVPVDDIYFSSSKQTTNQLDLCAGTYSASDIGTDGTIIINESGSSGTPKILDCHGATINGGGTGYGIFASSRNYLKIQNCNLNGYATQIYLPSTGSTQIQDTNVSGSSGTLNTGIQIGEASDHNFIRLNANNRQYGILKTNNQYSHRVRVIDSNINNTDYGIYSYNDYTDDWNIYNNNIQNADEYAINLAEGSLSTTSRTIIQRNNLYDSDNGIFLGSTYQSVIEDTNISNLGAVTGNAIYLSSLSGNSYSVDTDINRISANGRANGINTGNGKVKYLYIEDSNFNNCTNAMYTNGDSSQYWTLRSNNLKSAGDYALYARYGDVFTINSDNNFDGSTSGIQLDGWNTIEDLNIRTTSGFAIKIGQNSTIQNVDVSGLSGKSGNGIEITGNDVNIVNILANNRAYGINTGNTAVDRIRIIDSNFINLTGGIYTNGASDDWNIYHNNFQTISGNGVYARYSQRDILNRNNFINVLGDHKMYTSNSVNDANYNYWSSHSCTDTTPDDGICDNAFSFTGGADYTPSESQIE